MPPAKEIEFAIHLELGTISVHRAPYRMAPMKLNELMNQLKEFLIKGFIRPSHPVPPLMCIDYQELNKVTIENKYPLPKIDDLFD